MNEQEILPFDLSSIAELVDGRTGRQFAAAVRAVIGAATDDEAQRDGSGWAKGTVVVTLTVEARSEEDGGTVNIAVAVEAKPAKMRASGAVLTCLGPAEYGIDVTQPQTRLPFVAGQQSERMD